MKNKAIVFKILAFMFLIITLFVIKKTYSVFYSQMSGVSKSSVGKWNIEVNNTNISSGVNATFAIDTFNVDSNLNVLPSKLAPGTTGSCDIVIDPTDTAVSVRYDITIDQSKINNQNITLESIEQISDSDISLTKTGKDTYTAVIPVSKIGGDYINDVKLKFKWLNDDTNNESDSLIGVIKDHKLDIPITVSVNQYMGEDIIEYVEN